MNTQGEPTTEALPEETPAPFKVGQTVHLNSFSGVPLVVEGQFTIQNDPSSWIVGVVWIVDELHLQRAQFPADMLK